MPEKDVVLSGGALRSLRGKKTQAEVAAALGISISYLSDLEHSRNDPTLKTAQRIAVFFGVTVDALLRIPHNRPTQTPVPSTKTMHAETRVMVKVPSGDEKAVRAFLRLLNEERGVRS